MDPIFAEVLEFHDRGRVVKTLQLIEGHSRSLILSEPTADWTLAVDRLWVDDGEKALVLEAAAADWAGVDLPSTGLSLAATADGETLAFDGIAPVPEASEPDHGQRRFLIPERLRVENKRAGVRLTFVKGMSACFQARADDDEACLTARVVDLSIGGCQIELPVAAALTLEVDGAPLQMAVVFPNGDCFEAAAIARYVRLLGAGGLARAGLAFEPIDNETRQRLWLWLQEIEMEIAIRRGERGALRQTAGLFRPSAGHDRAVGRSLPRPPGYRTAMRRPLLGVARDLSRAALAVRAGQSLPADALVTAAEQLCGLLAEDRQGFLFALASMTEQPPLIQHSIAVAGRLADLISAEKDLDVATSEIALGALLHDLGLVCLTQDAAETLAATRRRADVQAGHHIALSLDLTAAQQALGPPVVRDLLIGLGASGHAIDEHHARVASAARVVKAVDVRVRGYHGHPPMTAFEACRQLYRDRDHFDDYWVRRYLQRQGPYPIGTIVRYGHGFRAQVVTLDDHGRPAQVRVLRNLKAAGHQRLNVVLHGVDLHQLGALEYALPHEPQELYAPPVADDR
ncbi:MAG: PilZ domain-containing protein [Salinisphaera sp.]|uniref:PilZ domain-containing protein n=1 Tax=Salinisphaera sp. TaxID=1914330 RepID=UPI003C7A2D69